MTHEQKALQRICKNLKPNDKEYVKRWYDGYVMFHALRDPIAESPEVQIDGKTYFCRREAFFSTYDGDINYGYCVYQWTGKYYEKPLVPGSDKTFKFKDWKEIFHSHGVKKVDPKEMIEISLKLIGITKEHTENESDID